MQSRAVTKNGATPLVTTENWRIRAKAFLRKHFGAYETDFDSVMLKRQFTANMTMEVAQAPMERMKLWMSLQAGIEWLEQLEMELTSQ